MPNGSISSPSPRLRSAEDDRESTAHARSLLLRSARAGVSYLKHLFLEAGYEGRGKRWAEEALGLRVEIVRKPAKPVPEKVAMIWAEEWAKEGKKVDWQRLAHAAQRLQGITPQVGGGKDLLLVGSES